MRLRLRLFQVLIIVCLVHAERSDVRFLLTPNNVEGERHSEGYCAMYDICGKRTDGKVLNCPHGSPSVKPDDLLSAKIQSLCPTITGSVCCTEAQFETLRAQVQQAIPFLVGCPACLRNFLNLFCELTCSPNQSLFINVTSVSKVNNNLTVDGIDFYVTDNFGEGLYDSCKDVKFGTMNSRALEFIGAGAQNFKGITVPSEIFPPLCMSMFTYYSGGELPRVKQKSGGYITVYQCLQSYELGDEYRRSKSFN